jgi:hypothetical protein
VSNNECNSGEAAAVASDWGDLTNKPQHQEVQNNMKNTHGCVQAICRIKHCGRLHIQKSRTFSLFELGISRQPKNGWWFLI